MESDYINLILGFISTLTWEARAHVLGLGNVRGAFEVIGQNKFMILFILGIKRCAIYCVCEVWLERYNSSRVVPNQPKNL